jgi:putative transposase
LRFAATRIKKIEFMFRKNIRLKFYDYKLNGYYFVTICCSYVAAERQLCIKYRDIIEKYLKGLEKNEGVRIDFYIIMPDHIHFILVLDDSNIGKANALPLHRYIQDFKSKTTLEIKKKGFIGKRFWQPNYYEHVIRNEKGLYKIREYIKYNAEKDKIDLSEVDKL